MTWAYSNLLIQTAAGIFGAHMVAIALAEFALGFLSHTLIGVLGGGMGGLFLQQIAVTMVTGSGSLNVPTVAGNVALQLGAGAASGACLMLVIGLIKHGIHEQRTPRE